jgi:aldehyde:ferredoxin oxidoreductase
MDGLDLHFGNSETMVEAIHKIANLEGKFGSLCAQGSVRATSTLVKGAERYHTGIKGIDTIASDPRVAKGFGFGYAVSTRGSDHLRAHPVFEMLNFPESVAKELFGDSSSAKLKDYSGKARMVWWHENYAAITDSMGSCRFVHASYYAQYPVPEILKKNGVIEGEPKSIKYHRWLEVATGIELTFEELFQVGERIIALERSINARRGISRQHDTLPRRFFEERIPLGPAKGELFDEKIFNEMLDEYYRLRGIDPSTGLYYQRRLKELKLDDVARVLKDEGLLISD